MEESGLANAKQLAKLCSGCHNLFEHWDDILERSNETLGSLDTSAEDLLWFPYDKDVRAWITSSNRGCALCMRLRSCLGGKGLNTIVEHYGHGGKLELYAEAERLSFLGYTISCHIPFPRRAAGMWYFLFK
jgi:hypothetical protein